MTNTVIKSPVNSIPPEMHVHLNHFAETVSMILNLHTHHADKTCMPYVKSETGMSFAFMI